MKSKAGFTLVELLIVMAIVAILGVIAVPSYRNYVVGARQNSAQQALLRMAGAMENCYSMNQTYVGCFGTNKDANKDGVNDFLKANDIENYYEFSDMTEVTARNFRVAVKATGGQAKDVAKSCQVLAVDRLGRKLSAPSGDTLLVDADNTCWP